MANSFRNDQQGTPLGQTSVGGVDNYSGGHALVPILIGLSVPALALIYFAPELLGGAQSVLSVYLFVLMAFSLGVFLVSVFNPGPVVAITFDGRSGYARITRAGPLAHTIVDVPLHKIEQARFEHCYDDDGYSWHEPQLVMSSGNVMVLPEDTTRADIENINTTLRTA
ncbi:MAG: hypothetical protein AAFV45_11210 [Pseudomonadota bacterium]